MIKIHEAWKLSDFEKGPWSSHDIPVHMIPFREDIDSYCLQNEWAANNVLNKFLAAD